MNRKSIFLALIVSLGVSFVLWKQIQTSQQQPTPGPTITVEPPKIPTVQVVVAKKRIPTRTRLEEKLLPELFEVKDVVASNVPAEAFAHIASLTNKYTSLTVLAGDIMSPERILDKDSVPNVSFAVPVGKRAFTIQVTPLSGVAGFIQQGDYVDVIATFRPAGKETTSKMVMQDIQVLAVGKTYLQELDIGASASPTAAIMSQLTDLITMAVTPEELESLMYLDSAGVTYRLLLKNPKDKDKKIVTKGATEKSVITDLGIQKLTEGASSASPEVAPTTPVITIAAPTIAPVVEPLDDGKVDISYGSKRKEEMYKSGAPRSSQQSPGNIIKAPTNVGEHE